MNIIQFNKTDIVDVLISRTPMVLPVCGKLRQNNNNGINSLVDKCTLHPQTKTNLPSVLDFCSSLRISSSYEWNKIPHLYPVPCEVIRHHGSLKESLDLDQDYHIPDGPAKIPPKTIIEADVSLEQSEKTSINVLLVDDDQDILFTFKSILEAEGYHVEAFADPNKALAHFIQMDPSYYSLVLTDIQMPNCNGFQLYQKLREINIGVRVIFMTAFDVPSNLQDTMPSIKEADIIKKPIEEEHFVSRIKKAIKLQ